MVFCGHCGYQLSTRDKICPRCGAETDIDPDLIAQDPEMNKPTEMAPAAPNFPRPSSPNQPGRPATPPQPAGPLVLGASGGNYAGGQDPTMMMSAPSAYAPQQAYPSYQPQAYGNMSYPQHYQNAQSAALAQLLAASHRGKTNSLLLILFGLLLLIASIIVFLLNQQGIIFTP